MRVSMCAGGKYCTILGNQNKTHTFACSSSFFFNIMKHINLDDSFDL